MDQFLLLEPRGEQDFLAELERHTHSTLGGDGAQGGLLHSLLALYAGMLADTAGTAPKSIGWHFKPATDASPLGPPWRDCCCV